MLHDPKVARLSDNLWRRFVECLLFAGEVNENGRLPPISDIAWVLQKDEETLVTEFDQLARYGLIDHCVDNILDDGYWFVVNFGKRQMPLSKADYMRRLREQRQKQEYHGDVTRGNAESDKDKDKETEEEVTDADVFTFYENNFTSLTPFISEEIGDVCDEYSPGWVLDAMKISIKNGVRRWNYVTAILERWKRDGKDSGKRTTEEDRLLEEIRASAYRND